MMLGRPMFMGTDELQQLLSICSICGTPSLTVWPEVIKLPRYYMLNSRPPSARCLLNEFTEYAATALYLIICSKFTEYSESKGKVADSCRVLFVRLTRRSNCINHHLFRTLGTYILIMIKVSKMT